MQPAAADPNRPDRTPPPPLDPTLIPDPPDPPVTAYDTAPDPAEDPFPSAQEIFRRSQTQFLKNAIAASLLNIYSVPLLHRVHRSQ